MEGPAKGAPLGEGSRLVKGLRCRASHTMAHGWGLIEDGGGHGRASKVNGRARGKAMTPTIVPELKQVLGNEVWKGDLRGPLKFEGLSRDYVGVLFFAFTCQICFFSLSRICF